jgi:hypothetical protein
MASATTFAIIMPVIAISIWIKSQIVRDVVAQRCTVLPVSSSVAPFILISLAR